MLKRPRIIPTLLIHDQNLVKTIEFKDERYLGDPINAVRIFNEEGVDELCIIDIGAAKERKSPDSEYLSYLATEAFMPMSYGGGITSIEQMKQIFKVGFEKVIINTAMSDNPPLIQVAVEEFGSQSIVAAIDYKKKMFRGNRVMVSGGGIQTEKTPLEYALKADKLGVGEILVYSIDKDGCMNGYDIETIADISAAVSVPVIACGGAGNLESIKELFSRTKADAAAAGSIFVFFGKKKAVLINYPSEQELIEQGIYYDEDEE